MRRLTCALVAILVVPAWVAHAIGDSPARARPTPAAVASRDLSGFSGSTTVTVNPAPGVGQRPAWKRKIDRIAKGRSIGISVRLGGVVLFERGARVKRVPASNEKLLLSMALYESLGPDLRLTTRAASASFDGDVVGGDLFILGTGDPTIASSKKYGRSFPFRTTRLGRLAHRIRDAGVKRITGSVVGGTNYFSHDWFAPGWKSYFPSRYVALPSALTFNGNRVGDNHISDPELRVAKALTKKLRKLGIAVAGSPAAGWPPGGLTRVARIRSERLKALVRYMTRQSSNFFAEVLGKRLGVKEYGIPGTIAKGAAAITAWTRSHDVVVQAYDGSGLSYSNRISPRGMTRSLTAAEGQPWGSTLRDDLPRGDQGTLEDRLKGVPVRAKTGTLTNISTLSGWIYLRKQKQWATFSIMSSGMAKTTAVDIEDRIVRILRRSAR